MSTQNSNVISGVTGIKIDDQILSIFLDELVDFVEESLAWSDMPANASYICFQNTQRNFHLFLLA